MDQEKEYRERLMAWEKAKFSAPPEKPLRPKDPTIIEMIRLRDGVRLYTEIYLPISINIHNCSIEAKFPTILSRSPYPYSRPSRHDKRSIERYLAAGYAVIFQLTRGQGKSEGLFRFLHDDINDGYDTVQWVSEQAWSNGNVGMEGSSYLGNTQLLAARAQPPALKCIMPTAFLGNITWGFPFSYGVLNKGPFMQWFQVADAERWDDMDAAYCDMNVINHPKWGKSFRKLPLVDAADEVLSGDKLDCWRETIANPQDNEYWQSIHFTDNELSELDIPIFFTDGWYDMTIGPINFFTRLEQLQPGRPDRYLLVGPWDHYQTYSASQPGDDNGDRVLPDNGAIDLVEQRLKFFDRYLKEDQASIVQKDRVQIYISGSSGSDTNKWFYFPTFPAPGTVRKLLYLHSQGDARTFPGDGILSWEKPTNDPSYRAIYKPTDRYTYNPALPTAFQVEKFEDRRNIEIRSDVLTYTSDPLEEPLIILGEMKLLLYAASDAPDTDWFSVVTEVYPDGQSKSFHYAPPAFRARYRKGMHKEVFLLPNKSEEYLLSLGPCGHQIAAGNRLRLSIFSAAFPEYAPNTNTGNIAETDIDMRAAQQTIFHDIDRPSHILLPTIKLN